MISINELKTYIDFISNKEQSGNNYTPEQFNMLVKRAVEDIQRWLIGLEAQYQPGAPVPAVAYEVTLLLLCLNPLLTYHLHLLQCFLYIFQYNPPLPLKHHKSLIMH